jgi:hypothetical protein
MSVAPPTLGAGHQCHPTNEKGARAANAQVQVHLKNSQTVITAKAFDKRSNDQVVALVGMDDEIIAVVKDSIAALIMDPAAKAYFGR